VNTGRTSSTHAGQMAGAGDPRRADRIPATNVPWKHAALLASRQPAPLLPETSRMLSVIRSGCPTSTGPSTRPILTSALPLPRAISADKVTRSSGFMLVVIAAFNERPSEHSYQRSTNTVLSGSKTLRVQSTRSGSSARR
jgi:hypothetical protein